MHLAVNIGGSHISRKTSEMWGTRPPLANQRLRYSSSAMRTLTVLLLALLAWSSLTAQKMTAPQLIALANAHSPALQDAITATFTPQELQEGTAWVGKGHDFFFALRSTTTPELFIDGVAGPQMQPLSTSGQWYAVAQIPELGVLHSFYYQLAGAKFGGRLDLPAFGPDSYLQPGVPSGTLSEKIIHTSKIYDGMKSEYWIYVPAGYDPKVPAALMVFQDGAGYTDRNGNNPALNVIDNLIAQKKIPGHDLRLHQPWRRHRRARHADLPLCEGLLRSMAPHPERLHAQHGIRHRQLIATTAFCATNFSLEVAAQYNIRKDAYSRAITGLSSGGICSFNAAWQMPDQFSRVITWIGSFTSIQWKEDPAIPDGGQDYPGEDLARAAPQPARMAAGRLQRPGERSLWKLAAGQHPHGQCAQAEELRFPFQLWQGNAQFRPRRSRVPGGDDLALARLRSSQDQPGI